MFLAVTPILFKASSTFDPISKAVESSANRLVSPFWLPDLWSRSLTLAEKEIRPKIDPCGTPYSMSA